LVAAEDVDLCLRLARAGKILSDPQIVNVHHGEPATLRDFFRKERWRGSSGLRAFWLQGCPWREALTLLYPAYYLFAVLALVAAIGIGLWQRSPVTALVALAALVMPAFLLAAKTSWQCGSLKALLPLTALYITYGLARAAALFKG
jgi:GT2 family glycosyltransferase